MLAGMKKKIAHHQTLNYHQHLINRTCILLIDVNTDALNPTD